MDISPINRDVIYRTRSAGPIISQYIGATRQTWILIIVLLHSAETCNLQFTLHFIAIHYTAEKKEKVLGCRNNLHMN